MKCVHLSVCSYHFTMDLIARVYVDGELFRDTITRKSLHSNYDLFVPIRELDRYFFQFDTPGYIATSRQVVFQYSLDLLEHLLMQYMPAVPEHQGFFIQLMILCKSYFRAQWKQFIKKTTSTIIYRRTGQRPSSPLSRMVPTVVPFILPSRMARGFKLILLQQNTIQRTRTENRYGKSALEFFFALTHRLCSVSSRQLRSEIIAERRFTVRLNSKRFINSSDPPIPEKEAAAAATTETAAVYVERECPICMHTLKADSAKLLICKHGFHSDCINMWLVTNPTCPVCRIHNGHVLDMANYADDPAYKYCRSLWTHEEPHEAYPDKEFLIVLVADLPVTAKLLYPPMLYEFLNLNIIESCIRSDYFTIRECLLFHWYDTVFRRSSMVLSPSAAASSSFSLDVVVPGGAAAESG